jgi:hypothetical protein
MTVDLGRWVRAADLSNAPPPPPRLTDQQIRRMLIQQSVAGGIEVEPHERRSFSS